MIYKNCTEVTRSYVAAEGKELSIESVTVVNDPPELCVSIFPRETMSTDVKIERGVMKVGKSDALFVARNARLC